MHVFYYVDFKMIRLFVHMNNLTSHEVKVLKPLTVRQESQFDFLWREMGLYGG